MTGFSWPRRKVLAGIAGLGVAGCTTQKSQPKGPVTVAVQDVPVGGGLVITDTRFVVTQPVAGEFHAFDRTCPHKQCPVTEVNGQAIICNCHGSSFDLNDGHVLRGPATTGLPLAKLVQDGDTLTISEL